MSEPAPLLWLNLVGLTPRLLAHAPKLSALAARGAVRALQGVVPAVTLPAQATLLTGAPPSAHGVVGNGWYRRETGEVRFWVQAHAQLERRTVLERLSRAARERGRELRAAHLFWWFAQGTPASLALTPKPWYGCDGSKAFGVHGRPPGLAPELERALGPFPFPAFWGPRAGLPSTEWIARAGAEVLRAQRPDLTLVYLPHLDYDLQRFGPDAPGTAARVAELDRAVAPLLEAAAALGARVLGVSEYGLQPVRRAVSVNRHLREAGLLSVRDGPFGEALETFESRAFAVVDHQVAHVYVREAADVGPVRERLEALPGVARALAGASRAEVGLDHARSGEIVLLAERDAWFAYPYWLDDRRAPDFARTVDIHRKPGYDPLELFVDPALAFPTLRVLRRLAQKKLGLRYRLDVVPLDPALVKGSHGVPPADPADGPLALSDDASLLEGVAGLGDVAGAVERAFQRPA